MPQAFQVIPVMVYRVYADGRPDELVRGVDIVGTPLLSLNNIMLTGDKLQVFNGICGAESGQVPVSAAAPAMLFSEIEVQKRQRGTERPPILPPPGSDSSFGRRQNKDGWKEPAMSAIKNHSEFFVRLLLIVFAAIIACARPSTAQEKIPKPASGPSDPTIKAMLEELDRSKSQLKMDNVPAPYYIEYRLSDVEEFDAEAAFGALREDQRAHIRSVRVVVRVGDYKQDSYYQRGMGVVDFAPVDHDAIALRRQLWSATDRAYKAASEALATKKAALSKYSADQPFDDFSKRSGLAIHRAAREASISIARRLGRSAGEIDGPFPHGSANPIALGLCALSRREPVFREHGRNDYARGLRYLLSGTFRGNAGERRDAARPLAVLRRWQCRGIAGHGQI